MKIRRARSFAMNAVTVWLLIVLAVDKRIRLALNSVMNVARL
jgi:hypothetical protein